MLTGCMLSIHLRNAGCAGAHAGAAARSENEVRLVPLWCLGDFLQMDELRAWCIERMATSLLSDAGMLEAAWEAALARPCDALCSACASAWLVSAAAAEASDTTLLELLARVQAGCAAGVSLKAQLVRVLRAAMQPAGAAAGAEA
jgi:hypothetical protein